jgi:YggT family protein
MPDSMTALATLTQVLRTALLAGGIAFAAVAAADWAVRTRRINPFSGVARFMRGRIEPRLAPMERQVVRAGGQPSTTPWWALLAYMVFAMLLLAALEGLFGLVGEARVAWAIGTVGLIRLVIQWVFTFLRFALIVSVIASWLPGLASSRWVRWSFGATDWMLRPLRRVIPTMGMIDITPIVAYFGLGIAGWLVDRILLAGLY